MIENNKINIKKQGQPDKTETVKDDGGYQGQFKDFYEAIRNDKPVKSSFSEAYQDFVTILKALESAENEKRYGKRIGGNQNG